MFLAHLPHIKRVAAHECRKRGFSREETEDFGSIVTCKLIEDDYAVIRKHREKSTLKTYLTVVIQHLFQDHLNHLWGKWRPSEEAKRLGPLAIQLDRLLHRDRLTLDEACKTLLTNHDVKATRQELEDLAAKLPPRILRPPKEPIEDEEALGNLPSGELPPDDRLRAQEGKTRLQEILEMLKEIHEQLPPQDALLVRMMSSGHKISVIARTLDLEQKPLYRRLEKILKELRQELERRGVRPEEISELLSIPEDDHEPPSSGVVKPDFRPSHRVAEPRRPEKGADFGVK
jgi:RNA polymerase sigma factor (sigma-70 family)